MQKIDGPARSKRNTGKVSTNGFSTWKKSWIAFVIVLMGVILMVVDDTLIQILAGSALAAMGWVFIRAETAHKRINKEVEDRHDCQINLMSAVAERMTRDEVIDMVDTRVRPIDENVKEVRADVKEILAEIRMYRCSGDK